MDESAYEEAADEIVEFESQLAEVRTYTQRCNNILILHLITLYVQFMHSYAHVYMYVGVCEQY